jgi:hypothetical protein
MPLLTAFSSLVRAQFRKLITNFRLRQSNSLARRRRPSRAPRPGRALQKRGARRGSPDYDTTQHAHAQKKAKRSGQDERSGEGGFEGLPDCNNPIRTHAEQDQADYQAEHLVRRSPPTTTIPIARAPNKAKPSAATRPCALERGVRESPLTATLQLAHALKKPGGATTPNAAKKRFP